MDTFKPSRGERVKLLRRRYGWSLHQVARVADVRESTWKQLEVDEPMDATREEVAGMRPYVAYAERMDISKGEVAYLLRKRLGWSLARVAGELGQPVKNVVAMERGDHNPEELLYKLTKLYYG